MKVLVTGGAGYIGSHTCKELHRRGHEPVVVDNLSRGHRSFVKWGPLYELSLHDTEALTQVLKQQKIEAVIHFAAFAYVGESVTQPLLYIQNNVEGSASLLRAMDAATVKNIIFSSTCATYGIPHSSPIKEDFPQEPINPYGRTKLMIEWMLKDLASAGKLSSIALRYFNAAGGDPDGEIGESHDPETHLIPLALKAVLDPKFTLSVYGDDYPTPDGTCVRDYIHVTDLARAHTLALESLSSGFQAINLGTGRGHSVKNIIDGVKAATGKNVKFKMSVRREGDPAELVADPTLANKALGWRPEFSDLPTILKTALAWYEKSSVSVK